LRLPNFVDVGNFSHDYFPHAVEFGRDVGGDDFLERDGLFFTPTTWEPFRDKADPDPVGVTASSEFIIGAGHKLLPIVSESIGEIITLHRPVEVVLDPGERWSGGQGANILASYGPVGPKHATRLDRHDFYRRFLSSIQNQWSCLSSMLGALRLGWLRVLSVKFREGEVLWTVRAVQRFDADTPYEVYVICVRDFAYPPPLFSAVGPPDILLKGNWGGRIKRGKGKIRGALDALVLHLEGALSFVYDDYWHFLSYYVREPLHFRSKSVLRSLNAYCGVDFECGIDEPIPDARRRVIAWVCSAHLRAVTDILAVTAFERDGEGNVRISRIFKSGRSALAVKTEVKL